MEVLEWVRTLLTNYGTVNLIIMVLVIVLTNIIKKPIVNKAENFVESAKKLTGIDVDKSVITSNIAFIPIGLAFVFYFIYALISVKFQFAMLDWVQVITNAIVYGMLSMSIFEVGKNKIKSYLSKKSYNEAKKQLSEIVNTNKQDTETDLLTSSEPEQVDSEVSFEDKKEEIKQDVKEKVENILEKITEVKNG